MPLHSAKPVLAVAGSFSIDAVLTQDGRHVVDKVGGNALWSALGAMIAGNAPRIVTVVGNDYPQDVLRALGDTGINTSAVRRIERSHPVRVTFAHLPDGSRLQPVPQEMLQALPEADRAAFVDTTSMPEVLPLGAPIESDIPDAWLQEVDHWHMPLLPLQRHRCLVHRLKGGRGKLQSDCPARSDLLGDAFSRLAVTLDDLDFFLPSTSDFDVIAPGVGVHEILFRLKAQGARAVVLKAGGDGVYIQRRGELFHMPAHEGTVVDPTGAGDAFCGGFMTGMAATGDMLHAAALGSAAASFAIATEDPLALIGVDHDEVRQRAMDLQSMARRIDAETPATQRAGAGAPAAINE